MKKLLFYAAFTLLGSTVHAQFLNPSAAITEITYPPTLPNPVGTTTNVSCYSLPVGWGGAGSAYGTVSSWDDPSGLNGIAWQIGGPASMGTVFEQGYLAYPAGASSINVGIINTGGGPQIDVSYHIFGVGHFYDIYVWNVPVAFGGPGGVTLVASVQLSTLVNPTRISMDTHIGYGTAIVWEDPGMGINVIAAQNNAFGPLFTFNGTAGHSGPDVAFTHSGGPLNIHVVSSVNMGAVFEYYVSWFDIIPGGALAVACGIPPPFATCALPNTVEDFNSTLIPNGKLHIDAPDHGPGGPVMPGGIYSNWAYTYTDGTDVFARIMNVLPGGPPMLSWGGVPATVNLTNGSYPNPPFLPAIGPNNDNPVLAWDFNQNSFYVGWWTNHNDPLYNPFNSTYVAIQLNQGGMIMNPALPNSFMAINQTLPWTSPTPAMYFSKQNDLTTGGLYSIFTQFDGIDNMIQHKIVPWSGGTFKGGTTTAVEEFSHHDHDIAIAISPNPFNKNLAITMPANMDNEELTVLVTDIYGKSVMACEGTAKQVNERLNAIAGSLATGNYMADVRIIKSGYHNVFKLAKSE